MSPTERTISRVFFCAACGVPAKKYVPPKGRNRTWKPGWRLQCAHVGGPVRMSAKRAAEVAEGYKAMRDARIARARKPIADCEGKPAA